MSAITFTRPGNIEGVGYLINYGGVPQFSIAWNGTLDPERILPANVVGEGLMINGKKADEFEVVVADGGYTLKEKPAFAEDPILPDPVVEIESGS